MLTEDNKKKIDAMTQLQMCSHWRFAPPGSALLEGETGEYFKKIMNEKGGMTPQISKILGWS